MSILAPFFFILSLFHVGSVSHKVYFTQRAFHTKFVSRGDLFLAERAEEQRANQW